MLLSSGNIMRKYDLKGGHKKVEFSRNRALIIIWVNDLLVVAHVKVLQPQLMPLLYR